MIRSFSYSLCFAAVAGLSSISLTSAEELYGRIVNEAIEGYILPELDNLQAEAENLTGATHLYCDGSVPRADINIGFNRIVKAYGRIDFLRFGPMLADNVLDRLYFWPDRKGLAIKRVERALREQDSSLLELNALQNFSVALQGLTAYEYLFFGRGAEVLPDHAYRCALGLAVARNIFTTSKTIRQAWVGDNGYAQLMQSPSASNSIYRSHKEAAQDIYAALGEGLETAHVLKITPSFGKVGGKIVKPKRSPFWRSEQTFSYLGATVQRLEDTMAASGMMFQLPVGEAYKQRSIEFEFSNTKNALEKLPRSPLEAYKDPAHASTLRYATITFKSLGEMLVEPIGKTLKFSKGFSSLDGD